MNISEVTFTLSTEDIESIIKNFVQVPGLAIDAINIDKHIYIKGSYKKILRISFKIELSLLSVRDESVSFIVEKVQVAKLPVFKWLVNLLLKKLIKTVKELGITANGAVVDVDIPKLLSKLPIKLGFKLDNIQLFEDKVYIVVKQINLCIKGQAVPEEKEPLKIEEGDNSNSTVVLQQEDKYTEFRQEIEKKVPEKNKILIPYIMLLPDFIALIIRLFKDKRVPTKIKIICGAIIAYFALPFDIVPDFLPIIGKIDDLAVVFYALNKIICNVPEEVIKENWEGEEEIILVIRKGIDILYNTIGITNIINAFRWFAQATKKKENKDEQQNVKENHIDGQESVRH